MDRKIIFLHIPKTAGSSFREALKKAIGAENVAWFGGSLEELADRVNANPNTRVIGGHFNYRTSRKIFGADHLYFATLRNPIERTVSLIRYIQRTQKHSLNQLFQTVPLIEALGDGQDHLLQFSNVQCAYLSESVARNFDAAWTSIIKNKILVNTLENTSLALREASRILRLDIPVQEMRRNVDPSKIPITDPVVLARIKALNKFDLMLYDTISKLYTDGDPDSYRSLGINSLV